MKRSLTVILGVLLIAGMTFVVTSIASQAQAQSQKKKAAKAQAQAAATQQPHLDEAYRKLRRAHYLLNNACKNLGGNREKANQQIEQALNEVQAGITAEHGSVPAVSESSDIQITPGQIHPYIHDALQKCREAKTQLQAAQAAGGHRDNAIQYINAAEPFLQAAIQEPPCH
jgi:flagellar biosynthesis component FlhA